MGIDVFKIAFRFTSLPFNFDFSVEILPIFVVGTKIHSLPRLDCTWNLGKIRWGLFEIFIQMCLALKSLQFSSLYSGTSLWFYIEGSQNIQNCSWTKDWESLTLGTNTLLWSRALHQCMTLACSR